MSASFRSRAPEAPWFGRQPKYEGIVAADEATRFALVTTLPAGEPVLVWLGRASGTGPSTVDCVKS